MTQQPHPPVLQMVREAVEVLGGKTTNIAVRNCILNKYPDTNKSTIGCQTIVATVNHPSRIHYQCNQKPRIADGHYDFLFRPATGEIELYDPARHGIWEIAEKEDGSLVVQQAGAADEISEPKEEGGTFAVEAHLRDYLAKNLKVIEEGLQLFVNDNGNVGVEYRTEVGIIDILAVDKNDGLLVIELKVAKGPDAVCGQIMRYVGWVKRHLADGKPVRGLIIAGHISDRIRYAIADLPNISVREYELNITLKDVPDIDA